MKKKIFTVAVKRIATIDIDVVAESEEQACRLAVKRIGKIPYSRYEMDYPDASDEDEVFIANEHNYSISDVRVGKAIESIRQEVSNDGDAVSFDSVEAHYDCLEAINYRECGMVEHTVYIDSAYVDENDRLWLQPEDGELEDFELDNFDEADQQKIIDAILNRK